MRNYLSTNGTNCETGDFWTNGYSGFFTSEIGLDVRKALLFRSYSKEEILFFEGQIGDGIYFLRYGSVKLSACSKDGKMLILQVVEPGEVLGLSAVLSCSAHPATAEALEPCGVDFMSRRNFLQLLESDATVCLKVLRQLNQNYQTICNRMLTLGLSSSVADKLAALFLNWCGGKKSSSDGSISLTVKFTHEEIAQMIGTSRETVTRLLKNFQDRRLVLRKGSNLIIPDRLRLEAAIGTR